MLRGARSRPAEFFVLIDENGDVVKCESAKDGSYEKLYYNNSLQLTNNYNKKGELTSVTDSLSNTNVACVYNALGQMTSYTEKQNSATKVKQVFTYDEYGNISQEKITGQASQTYKYSYDNLSDRRFNGMSFDGIKVDIKYYENLDRIKTKKVTYNGTEIYTKTYYYRKVKHDSFNYATNQPESIIYTQGEVTKQNIQYTYYDATGLLSDISYNGDSIHYSYDGGKLSRENNQLLGMSRIKYYHDNGNISMDIKGNYTGGTAAISNSSSTSYSYSGDRMMSFGNQACEYDSMGNPTKYRGKSATWKGRQLTQLGNTKFTYDGQGRRISKNSLTFLYDSNGNIIKQSDGLEFFYDFEGIAALKRNNTMYFCLRDSQGNIIALIDNNGNTVVQYYYDAWGNHKVVDADGDEITAQDNIGNLNPFRYRGYYYDTETGLYFLQTRYYDPEVGRFLNRDSVQYADPETINGLNLYAYCLNNPVEYVDPEGTSILGFLATVAISSLVSWAITEACGANIASGIFSIIGGGNAFFTGVSLLAFGPIGWFGGAALILVGAGTVLFGANEIALGITGTNYIQSWTGMSDALYNGLNIGLNTASAIGSVLGNFYTNITSTAKLNAVMKDPKLIQNYSKFQFKTYARLSSKWKLLPSKNGKGMRALSLINKGNSIRYGYGIYNAEHYYGAYYWIVANGKGKFRYPFR